MNWISIANLLVAMIVGAFVITEVAQGDISGWTVINSFLAGFNLALFAASLARGELGE